jgi:hypothetical protein
MKLAALRLATVLTCILVSPLLHAQQPSTTAPRNSEPAPKPADVWMFVAPAKANVLVAPATRARPVERLDRRTRVRVTNQTKGWFEVEVDGGDVKGWMRVADLAEKRPAPGKLTDRQLRRTLIDRSIADYDGNCPCPYNTDRIGRSCGGRSAWSRAGGSEPYCYEKDVPQEEVDALRREQEGAGGTP